VKEAIIVLEDIFIRLKLSKVSEIDFKREIFYTLA